MALNMDFVVAGSKTRAAMFSATHGRHTAKMQADVPQQPAKGIVTQLLLPHCSVLQSGYGTIQPNSETL